MARIRNLIIGCFVLAASCSVHAVSPETIELGRQLFQKNWTQGNPTLGSDGLGPLFNAQSCVACHHQGGVGGGGDARFNAKTIGIESVNITGARVDNDAIKSMVSTFHPGFIAPDGTLGNSLSLSHHGGSPNFQLARTAMMSQIDTEFSSEGGPSEASEVRRATATPIIFNNKVGEREITIRARMFQRNTSPLFGLALIDKIDGRDLEEQIRLQKQHPEISGRPSTLRTGRYGKFGWRGNVASLLDFVDQACAAEVGLETKRKKQPADPMNRNYRNTSIDVKDKQIIAMRDFVAALPAPTREIPADSYERSLAAKGEQLFASVGCAVCHVPNMGPAKGVYSDILLHDMGYETMDLNHAEPYIVRATPITLTSTQSVSRTTGSGMMGGYYGGSAEISVEVNSLTISSSQTRSSSGANRGMRAKPGNGRGFVFQAPQGPEAKMAILMLDVDRSFAGAREEKTNRVGSRITGDFNVRSLDTTIRQEYVRLHYEHTNFNQEWRTPPLWGLRDSAPYMHDGRAETVLEAIAMHDGESAGTRDRYLQLPLVDRQAVLAFLNTLVAPKNVPQFQTD